MNEFRSIPGFEEYEASSEGIIRRSPNPLKIRIKINLGRIMKQSLCKKSGYLAVCLSRNGKTFYPNVHILVARAFLGPKPTEKIVVNHKDEDKLNNAIQNLEYCTRSYNISEFYRRNPGQKDKLSKAHLGKPSGWAGKKHSSQTKLKMRLAKLGKPGARKGKKYPRKGRQL